MRAQRDLLPLLLCGNRARRRPAICELGGGPSADINSAGTLTLDFSASRTIRNKCVVYKPPSPWYSVIAAQMDWYLPILDRPVHTAKSGHLLFFPVSIKGGNGLQYVEGLLPISASFPAMFLYWLMHKACRTKLPRTSLVGLHTPVSTHLAVCLARVSVFIPKPAYARSCSCK